MRKILLTGWLIMVAGFLSAQYTINDPFTRWGVGEVAMGDNTSARALGGASLFPSDYNIVNLNSAASYALLKETTFQAGGWVSESKYQPSSGVFRSGQWGEMAMGFKQQGSKYGFAMGVNTFSRMGYNFGQSFTVNDSVGGQQLHSGEGGIHQFVFGAARKWAWGQDSAHWVGHQLSVGVNGAFMFGSLGYHRNLDFENTQTYNSRFDNWVSVQDIRPDFSFQYQFPLIGNVKQKEKTNLWVMSLAGQYTPEFNLNGDQNIYGISYVKYAGVDVTIDTGFVALNQAGSIAIPQRVQFGGVVTAFLKSGARLDFYGQYARQDWRNSTTSFALSAYSDLNVAQSTSIGVEFIPLSNERATNALQLTHFRLGYKTGQDYIKLDNQAVQVQVYSAGLSIPIRASKTNSSIQLSYQWLNKSTTSGFGMHQSIVGVGFQMSPFERWFVVRKYD
ncbi:MAG: hypothetical protein RL521_1600 [Bacteroidota bacterium]|jgi:hypothetical protein